MNYILLSVSAMLEIKDELVDVNVETEGGRNGYVSPLKIKKDCK